MNNVYICAMTFIGLDQRNRESKIKNSQWKTELLLEDGHYEGIAYTLMSGWQLLARRNIFHLA